MAATLAAYKVNILAAWERFLIWRQFIGSKSMWLAIVTYKLSKKWEKNEQFQSFTQSTVWNKNSLRYRLTLSNFSFNWCVTILFYDFFYNHTSRPVAWSEYWYETSFFFKHLTCNTCTSEWGVTYSKYIIHTSLSTYCWLQMYSNATPQYYARTLM